MSAPPPADLEAAVERLADAKAGNFAKNPGIDARRFRPLLVEIAHRELDIVGYGRLVEERDDALLQAENLRREVAALRQEQEPC